MPNLSHHTISEDEVIILLSACNSTVKEKIETYNLIFFFWPYRMASGILVSRPGIKPMPPAVEARVS